MLLLARVSRCERRRRRYVPAVREQAREGESGGRAKSIRGGSRALFYKVRSTVSCVTRVCVLWPRSARGAAAQVHVKKRQ